MAYLLIVDDDEDFGTFAAHVLRDAGHEVAVEVEIERAVRNMEERRPALAILDVMFPESSSAGFELARTMRLHNERLRDIPILFLTAVNSEFPLGFSKVDLDERWLPAEDFLEKPVDLNILVRKVAELLLKHDPGAEGDPASEGGSGAS